MLDRRAECLDLLRATVPFFRLGMEGQANENLVGFVDSFVQILQESKGVDFEQINIVLGELLAAQSRKDYLFVADILEYQLAAVLENDLNCRLGQGER